MSQQQLTFAEVVSPVTKTLNIGITHQLNSPFNLFVNFDHLIDPLKRYIYLFVYSMGQKRIAGWGVYDRLNQSFELAGMCRYLTPQLYPMTLNWIDQGFKYVGNAVTNRPKELISKYLDEPMMTYDDYKKSKFLVAHYQQKITLEELDREYPGLWEQASVKYENPLDFIDYMEALKREVLRYEEKINRVDLSSTINRHPLRYLLEEITQHFYQYLAKSSISGEGYEKLLTECPYLETCKLDQNVDACEIHLGFTHEDDLDFT
jgi:hypothetical protein